MEVSQKYINQIMRMKLAHLMKQARDNRNHKHEEECASPDGYFWPIEPKLQNRIVDINKQ